MLGTVSLNGARNTESITANLFLVLGAWKLLSPPVPLPESTPQMQSPMLAAELPTPSFHLTLSSSIAALMDDMILHPIATSLCALGSSIHPSDHYSTPCILERWWRGSCLDTLAPPRMPAKFLILFCDFLMQQPSSGKSFLASTSEITSFPTYTSLSTLSIPVSQHLSHKKVSSFH